MEIIKLEEIIEEVKKIQLESFREDSKQAYYYTQAFLTKFLELAGDFINKDNTDLPDVAQRAIVLCRVFNYMSIRMHSEATLLSVKERLNMHKNQNDLEKLKSFKEDIDYIHERIRDLKSNCKHETFLSPSYVETLAFEFTPKKECALCGKHFDVTDEEKINLLKEWYQDIELPISEEDIQKKKDGFNL